MQILAYLRECIGNIVDAQPVQDLVVESTPVLRDIVEKTAKNGAIIEINNSRRAFNLLSTPFTCSRQREKVNLENERAIALRQDALQKIIMNTGDFSLSEETRIEAAEELDRIAKTRKLFTVHTLSRNDDLRCVIEMLMLYIVRQYVPLKYRTVEEFLEAYPNKKDRSEDEQTKLWRCANWFDVCLLTLRPQNNKSHLMAIVPRLAEGSNARYVTGSGESRATADRVDIFRSEGAMEKVTRAPRKRTNFAKGKKRLAENADARSLQIQIHGLYILDGDKKKSSPTPPCAATASTGPSRKRSKRSKEAAVRFGPAVMSVDTYDDLIPEADSYSGFAPGFASGMIGEPYELSRLPAITFDSGVNQKGYSTDLAVTGPHQTATAGKVASVGMGGGDTGRGQGDAIAQQTYRKLDEALPPAALDDVRSSDSVLDLEVTPPTSNWGIKVLLDAIQADSQPRASKHIEYFDNLRTSHAQESEESHVAGGLTTTGLAREGRGAYPNTCVLRTDKVAPTVVTSKPRNAVGVKYGDMLRAMSVRKKS